MIIGMLNMTLKNAHHFQISVYCMVCVNIFEAFGHIQHLCEIVLLEECGYKGGLTRLIRFTPGFLSMNSVTVPFIIHSETIWKGLAVMPTKGTRFGWLNLFHITAFSKKDCRRS